MQKLKLYLSIIIFLPEIHLKVLNVRNYHDPGTCAKANHGALILVKDRESKDAIVICSEEKGVYSWKTLEGSRPPGEYFNPGYDCLDILNRNEKAKDGYYWVDFHSSTPYKVFCDMTTDDGGYMLIGRMNDSVTWTVPSNERTVEPFEDPQWSSSFGDLLILDFRIQVATDEEYKQVKAHWSYRFRNKRPLKKLMMVNEGGCPYNRPGIGDISHVKNLITKEIASKNFSCSVFGSYSHPSANIGWTRMNTCLREPCPYGFAYHHLIPIQLDFSGGFSFRAENDLETSDGATAFFGCDKGKCCACYGPVGGKRAYCDRECKAKNGGTVKKNVNAWFWVRLNPPRKVWEKCMEYRTEEENGEAAWYRLTGNRNTPEKGRCGKSEAILNGGIVVVPDNVTQSTVPQITGLLSYQKDVEVLRIRQNNAWKVLAEEEKMLQAINESITKMALMVNLLTSRDISASAILRNESPKFLEILKQWISFHTLLRCYRASEDGWHSNVFHLKCGEVGKTVTLIKVGRYIFGGYSDQDWEDVLDTNSRYKSSSNCFIFSFRNKDNLSPFKSNVYQNSNNAIYTSNRRGPSFGGGQDISISYNAKRSSCNTNFGHTYLPPSGYGYGSRNTRALLAGSYYFYPSEIEVYFFA